MKKRIYLSEELAPSAYNRLLEKYKIVQTFDEPELIEGIITRKIAITREIISKVKNCKVIANHGTGRDQIDVKAAEEYGIPVINAEGLNAHSVAELALGFFLSLSFKMKYLDSGMQIGKFQNFGQKDTQGNEIYGKKLGILGSGYIARELADMMTKAFGATVFCYNPHRTCEELKALGFIKVNTLEELFTGCDFISIHIPLNDETRNLINKKILEQANPELILVNTSRGGIINENDLYEALKENKIKAAACDVFEKEPPEKDNSLLALPNFIGTLHVGGSTKEALEKVGNKTVDNIEQYVG